MSHGEAPGTSQGPASFTVDLPLSVPIRVKGPKWRLNLNVYRNTNEFDLNKAKRAFELLTVPLVLGARLKGPVGIEYVLWYDTNGKVDVANVCCIVDKFFSDVLSLCEVIPDDRMEELPRISFRWGGVDKDNPRVEATVTEIHSLDPEPKGTPMKIIFEKAELDKVIQQAVNRAVGDHIQSLVNLGPDKAVVVNHLPNGDVEVQVVQAGLQHAGAVSGRISGWEVQDLPVDPEERIQQAKEAALKAQRDSQAASDAVRETETQILKESQEAFKEQLEAEEPKEVQRPWLDADGDAVDEERFIGLTKRQIGGIKGAEKRHGKKEQGGLVQPMDNVPEAPAKDLGHQFQVDPRSQFQDVSKPAAQPVSFPPEPDDLFGEDEAAVPDTRASKGPAPVAAPTQTAEDGSFIPSFLVEDTVSPVGQAASNVAALFQDEPARPVQPNDDSDLRALFQDAN